MRERDNKLEVDFVYHDEPVSQPRRGSSLLCSVICTICTNWTLYLVDEPDENESGKQDDKNKTGVTVKQKQ